MPLKDKVEQKKCVETVWGKLIPEKEAYKFATREIAAFCANLSRSCEFWNRISTNAPRQSAKYLI